MTNLYKRLIQLLPSEPVNKGVVIATHTDGVTVELIDGSTTRVRGEAAIGDHIFIRAGEIAGPAPDLTGADQHI